MATKQELKQRLVNGVVIEEKDIHDLIDVAGSKGAKGDKGDKGDKGEPGSDGFGTEAQYNDIIARLDALEDALESDE